MGRHPTIAQIENKYANGKKGFPSFSRITYIGPPCSSPAESLPRNITDRLLVKKVVDIPTKAVTHIQNNAPGPPILIATATPAMFPIPTVEASAVERAS